MPISLRSLFIPPPVLIRLIHRASPLGRLVLGVPTYGVFRRFRVYYP